MFSAIPRSLGSLNHRYGEFFDVKDRGLDPKTQAVPVSKTRASTGFHIDSSAVNYCPAAVGLPCLQRAHSGGESLLADAEALHDSLAAHHPKALSVLTQSIYRDVITPGTQRDCNAIRQTPSLYFRAPRIAFTFATCVSGWRQPTSSLGNHFPKGYAKR